MIMVTPGGQCPIPGRIDSPRAGWYRGSDTRRKSATRITARRAFSNSSRRDTQMKAFIYREYGSPDVLKLEDIPKPVPKDDEVLVKVHAASLNAYDWHLLRADPFQDRLRAEACSSRKTRFSKRTSPGVSKRSAAEIPLFIAGQAIDPGRLFGGTCWSQREGSNLRPADYESAALPTELRWPEVERLYPRRGRLSRAGGQLLLSFFSCHWA